MASQCVETLAIHLPKAVIAALASSARRAAASSLLPSSASGSTIEVYAAEAALILPTASAARRAVNHGFPPCASGSKTLAAPRLPYPPTITLSALGLPSESTSRSALLLPSATAALAWGAPNFAAYPPRGPPGVVLLPYGSVAAMRRASSSRNGGRYNVRFASTESRSRPEEPTPSPHPTADCNGLITFMNQIPLNLEEERLFRKAFNEKHRNFSVTDIGDYLERQNYGFEEWLYILRIVDRKVGPQKELMEIMIKEDYLCDWSLGADHNENPDIIRTEVKVDIVLKKLEQQGYDITKLLALVESRKTDWGSITVFGRKLDLTKVASIVWKLKAFIFGI